MRPTSNPPVVRINTEWFLLAGETKTYRSLRSRAPKVAESEKTEPVAWTFTRADGGRSFYTSLGHPDDFTRPEFRTLLKNALAFLTSR